MIIPVPLASHFSPRLPYLPHFFSPSASYASLPPLGVSKRERAQPPGCHTGREQFLILRCRRKSVPAAFHTWACVPTSAGVSASCLSLLLLHFRSFTSILLSLLALPSFCFGRLSSTAVWLRHCFVPASLLPVYPFRQPRFSFSTLYLRPHFFQFVRDPSWGFDLTPRATRRLNERGPPHRRKTGDCLWHPPPLPAFGVFGPRSRGRGSCPCVRA